jgi:hypothetical protein
MTLNRKRIVRIIIAIVIILAVMLTMHILVNNLDVLGFMRRLHGG